MLKKDLIELCLLHLLSVEDLYGYEILRRIAEGFHLCLAPWLVSRRLYRAVRGENFGWPDP